MREREERDSVLVCDIHLCFEADPLTSHYGTVKSTEYNKHIRTI